MLGEPKLILVTHVSCLVGVTVLDSGGKESMRWKPSRLQGVGPMGMPVNDPKEGEGRPADKDASASSQLVRSYPRHS